MGHKFNPEDKEKLDTKRRRRNLPPNKVLEKFGLKKGDTVADIGCGIGYFTIPMAKFVNDIVYAVDLSQEMLAEVASKKQAEGLDNIELLESVKAESMEADSIDFMLMSNLIHEVVDKKEFLYTYLKKLKTSGRLIIIDFKKIDSEFGPPKGHRVSKSEIYDILVDLGLDINLVTDLNQEQYGILANKAD